jgi:hypothetical protein
MLKLVSSRNNEPCTRLSFTKVKAPVDDKIFMNDVHIWFSIEGGAKITLKGAEQESPERKPWET